MNVSLATRASSGMEAGGIAAIGTEAASIDAGRQRETEAPLPSFLARSGAVRRLSAAWGQT